MKQYDYIIVGSGLFGAVFAHEATKMGKRCLVLEKRNHTGGNIYCENIEDITVHKYGAHIFHTSNKNVWNYVSSLCEFNGFINTPKNYIKLMNSFQSSKWNIYKKYNKYKKPKAI